MQIRLMITLMFLFLPTFSLKAEEISSHTSTAYARVLKLFDEGYLPDFSKFDTTRGLPSKRIHFKAPNTLDQNSQIVCEDLSDEVIEDHMFCGDFKRDNTSYDFAQIKSYLIRTTSPLVKSSDGRGFESSYKTPENQCKIRVHWREAKLESGARVLISKSIGEEIRRSCYEFSGNQGVFVTYSLLEER